MFRNMQGWQIVIIVLAIIILVGWKRLPDAARSLGRSMRIFKSEVDQMKTSPDDDKPSAASSDTVDSESSRRPAPAHERASADHPREEREPEDPDPRASDEHRS